MKKKIAIIGTQGVPSKYGGFETLVEYLLINLSENFEITVFCSSKYYKDRKLKKYKGAKLQYINLDANGWQSIFFDAISILKSYKKYDKVLILGSSGAFILPFLSRYRKKFILNFGGLDWKRNKWNKFARYYLKISEKVAVLYCGQIIADNQGILEYIFYEYNKSSSLIAYGGDQAVKAKIKEKKYKFQNTEYCMTVARIQKDNNIELILESFISLPKNKIVIVGNWNKDQYGLDLKEKYKNYNNIYLLDAIYDLTELNILRSNSTIYIHAHSAGGTNPALVEAMNLGLPIFAYSSGFNEHTTHSKGRYFKSTKELSTLIGNADKTELSNLGNKMKKIAIENYTWDIISKKYQNIINL